MGVFLFCAVVMGAGRRSACSSSGRGSARRRRSPLDAELVASTSELSRRLFSGELFGGGPVGIVGLEDAVAVAVETEWDAMSDNHGPESAEIAECICDLELEVSGEDLSGGVVLKADESELGAAAFEPVMTAGIGERHHAEAWAGWSAGAVLTRPAFLRRGQFRCPPKAALRLAAHLDALFRL